MFKLIYDMNFSVGGFFFDVLLPGVGEGLEGGGGGGDRERRGDGERRGGWREEDGRDGATVLVFHFWAGNPTLPKGLKWPGAFLSYLKYFLGFLLLSSLL